MTDQVRNTSKAPRRIAFAVTSLTVALLCFPIAGFASAHGVVWVYDAAGPSRHRLRGKAFAEAHLHTGRLNLYVPICTFTKPDPKDIRRYEIRKALYEASGVHVMANLCNDIMPNGSQQEAFVAGYNSVMEPAIERRPGLGWKKAIEKEVGAQLILRPKGKLRPEDIWFETPY